MYNLQATLAMVLFPISYLSPEANIIKSTIDLMYPLKAIARDHNVNRGKYNSSSSYLADLGHVVKYRGHQISTQAVIKTHFGVAVVNRKQNHFWSREHCWI